MLRDVGHFAPTGMAPLEIGQKSFNAPNIATWPGIWHYSDSHLPEEKAT
jgi:hypothetical protein